MIQTKLCVQDYTPHDQSLLYELSMLYWQQRGLMAWLSGEVPHRITSSYGMAKSHAAAVVAHVEDLSQAGSLAADQPLWVLEIGGGLGTFASHFLSALETDCGDQGRALLGRLRYVYSDYSARTIEDAVKMPALAPWVARGIVQPARFDMRNPSQWEPLGGEARTWDEIPLLGVLANYVCCVAGSKLFQHKASDRQNPWRELFVQVMASLPPDAFPDSVSFDDQVEQVLHSVRHRTGTIKVGFEFQQAWRPVPLDAVFGDKSPHHIDIIRAVMSPFDEATLVYPHVYIDCILSLREHLLPGGFLMTSDYGSGRPENLVGLQDKTTQLYGNTVNYGVNFSLFDALNAQIPGFDLLRNQDTLRAMHHAMLLHQVSAGPNLRATFTHEFDVEQAGEALVEYIAAAHRLFESRDFISAARFYRRCIALDPTDLVSYERAGQAAIESGCLHEALQFFAQGQAADPTSLRDFPFQTARTFAIMHRWHDALSWYQRSLAAKPHHVTWTNIAGVYRNLHQPEAALEALEQALTLNPTYDRALDLRAEIQNPQRESTITFTPEPSA